MRKKDTSDVISSAMAVVADGAAIFGGFLLATWLRFDSGLIPLFHESPPPHLYFMYGWGAVIATVIFLFIFRSLGLFVRPQTGPFSGAVPRLVRATGLGILLTTAFAFALRTEPPFSRLVVAIAFFAVLLLLLIERHVLHHVELYLARHHMARNRVLILGTDAVAARLKAALENEPRLGARVAGFLRTDASPPDPAILPEQILGSVVDLGPWIEKGEVDQVILTRSALGHRPIVEIILLCEKNLVTFQLVPDLFRILISGVDMQMVDNVPLLGVGRWPLDCFWNRVWKRLEDVVGASIGLLIAAPVIGVLALIVKRSSPGPALYRQERCGESGKRFTIYKMRTMRADAGEAPGWTVENDPRRTRVGAFLRRHNLDELPQLWNVLKGEMSLVGPRPEQPQFVEQFKEDIRRYMRRHVSRPGMTGWAQVNGLRGNTSIEDRIEYDLYYLENWSLAFDFKILARTLLARKNAY